MPSDPIPLTPKALQWAAEGLREDYDEFSNFIAAPGCVRATFQWIWSQADIVKAKTPELVACTFFHKDADIRSRAATEVARRYMAEVDDCIVRKAGEIDNELREVA